MRVKATTKGQIAIPAMIRRKYGIKKGTRIEVSEDQGRIILRPLTPEAVEKLLDKLQGSLKGSGTLEELMEERRRDRAKEDLGWTPPGV